MVNRFPRLTWLVDFLADETGPTAVEYAVVLALIVIVCASAIGSIGNAAYESLWVIVETLD